MNKDNVADSSNFESKTEYLRLRKSSRLKKGLSFKDLLFLSLGGQAPFLNLCNKRYIIFISFFANNYSVRYVISFNKWYSCL